MHTETRTRNTNPEIQRLMGLLGPLTRDGRHDEAAKVRQELDYAKRRAALIAAARNAPPLQPEVLASVVTMLAGAVVTDA